MLRSAVNCQRCVFTEPKRCDARLLAWLSNLPPLPEALALARQAFPRRGLPQEWNLCLCHLTRRRVIARAQKERLRRERPRHYLSLDAGTKDFVLAWHTPLRLHGAEQDGYA